MLTPVVGLLPYCVWEGDVSLLNSCLDSEPLSLRAIQVLCGLLKVIDRTGQVSVHGFVPRVPHLPELLV